MVSPRKRQLKIDEDHSSIQPGASESSSKRQEISKAGLVRPEEVRDMMESSRNERARNLASDGAAQGETVHRVGGRVVSEAEWRESRQLQDPKYRKGRQRELDREFNQQQEKQAGWGRGMEQSSDRLRKAEEAALIASLPIGSSSSAQESINRPRWDDPLNRIKSEYVSPVATSSKPISMYQAPSNRFNIRAGYRWDGVVRGTNYEQRWFERQNESRNVGDFTSDYSRIVIVIIPLFQVFNYMHLLIPILLPIVHSITPSLPHTLVAFGDWGHAENVDLLDRINHYLEKVDGVFLLGDNFYPSGICPDLGLDDPQFARFANHLAKNLRIPFFVVLGNHDYMQNGQSAEIQYKHPLWVIDDGPYFVQFPFKDELNACVWFVDSIHLTPSSLRGLSSSISEESSSCVWKILATHYPVITAGVYKDDATVGEFREKVSCLICRFDFVISGHEHSSQVLLDPNFPHTYFLIAGASTQTYAQSIHRGDPQLVWGDDESAGVILRLSVSETFFRFAFIRLEREDKETVLFNQTVLKESTLESPVCPHTCK